MTLIFTQKATGQWQTGVILTPLICCNLIRKLRNSQDRRRQHLRECCLPIMTSGQYMIKITLINYLRQNDIITFKCKKRSIPLQIYNVLIIIGRRSGRFIYGCVKMCTWRNETLLFLLLKKYFI